MERQRGIKGLSIVALLVAIVGLSIAFAALSSTLTINGTAKVEASNWDVHFETKEGSQSGTVTPTLTKGGASSTATASAATLTATTVSGYDVVLKEPGDKAEYKFNVVNAGQIDAYIETFIKATPVCTPIDSNGDAIAEPTAADTAAATLVCNNLTYTLTYDTNDTVAQGTTVAQSNPLTAKGALTGASTTASAWSRPLVLTIGYDLNKSTTTVPATAVKITSVDTSASSTAAGTTPQASFSNGLYISIVYAQANSNN